MVSFYFATSCISLEQNKYRKQTFKCSSTKQSFTFISIFICDDYLYMNSAKFPTRQHRLTSFVINETLNHPTILPLSLFRFSYDNAEATFFTMIYLLLVLNSFCDIQFRALITLDYTYSLQRMKQLYNNQNSEILKTRLSFTTQSNQIAQSNEL